MRSEQDYYRVAKIIGDRIRCERERCEWSQGRLGRSIGYSQQAISDFEQGNRVLSVVTLIAIARAMGCDVNKLID